MTANIVTRIENGADAKQSTVDRLVAGLLEHLGVELSNHSGRWAAGAGRQLTGLIETFIKVP